MSGRETLMVELIEVVKKTAHPAAGVRYGNGGRRSAAFG